MVKPMAIKEHMSVVGSDGAHVGTVDHMDGQDKIKLTKGDASDKHHHLIPLSWVDHVDQEVHLNRTCADAKARWQTAA